MLKRKIALWTILFAISAMIAFAFEACAKKPNLQELQQLEEQRRSIDEQEKKLQELKSEREKLETALEAKKSELKKLESERDSLKGRLGQ